MPHAIHRLFGIILVYCAPTNVRNVWNDYIGPISEVFKCNENLIDFKRSDTLKSLKFYLESMGKCIENYDLLWLRSLHLHCLGGKYIAPYFILSYRNHSVSLHSLST